MQAGGKKNAAADETHGVDRVVYTEVENCTVFVKNSPVLLDSFGRIIYNSDISTNIGIWRGTAMG